MKTTIDPKICAQVLREEAARIRTDKPDDGMSPFFGNDGEPQEKKTRPSTAELVAFLEERANLAESRAAFIATRDASTSVRS